MRALAVLPVLAFTCGFMPASATAPGWVRLAHFSPNTPAVDVYLSSYGSSKTILRLDHVAYGGLSAYQKLPAGYYTIAMRGAGAAAASPPVISANVRVRGGDAHTIAGVGPASGLRLQVLSDKLRAAPGKANVRVIEASLRQRSVDVTAGGTTLAKGLRLAGNTPYRALPAGTRPVTANGETQRTGRSVRLAAGSTHTIVVLDGPKNLRLLDLDDAAAGTPTKGPINTGLGGTVSPPRPATRAPSSGDALALVGGGLLVAGVAAFRLRRR